jgi:hypothetical protein
MTGLVACIVEGDGEVEAVPLLVHRVAIEAHPDIIVKIARPPIRVPRNKLVKAGELERAVELAARRVGSGGATFVLIDSDDDCPAWLGPELQKRAQAVRPGFPVAVVLAKREYEAWFLAAAKSLRGKRELRDDLTPPADPESIRDAKGWLRDRMPDGRKYRETLDQPALTALFDFQAARVSDSFDKCYREIVKLIKRLRDRAAGEDAKPPVSS